MATATGLMTISEFESLSGDAARNKELVAGELVEGYELFQDLLVKAQLYLRCGMLEVWLISIKSRDVIRLTHERREVLEDNEEVHTSLPPSFGFRLRDYLRRPDSQ